MVEYKVFLKSTASAQALHQPSRVGQWGQQYRQEPCSNGAAGDAGDSHCVSPPAAVVHHLPPLHQGCMQGSFKTGGKQVWEMPWVEKKWFGGRNEWPCGKGRAQRCGVLKHHGLCTSAHHPMAKGGPKVFEGAFQLPMRELRMTLSA